MIGPQFGYLELEIVLSAEGEMFADLLGDASHTIRRVPEYQRSPRESAIDVLIAVNVPYPASLAMVENSG